VNFSDIIHDTVLSLEGFNEQIQSFSKDNKCLEVHHDKNNSLAPLSLKMTDINLVIWEYDNIFFCNYQLNMTHF